MKKTFILPLISFLLCCSNLSAQPTIRLAADINQTMSEKFITARCDIGGQIIYSGHSASHGEELFTSDSQGMNLKILHDFVPGAEDGLLDEWFESCIVYDGYLYVGGVNDIGGVTIIRTNGTKAGTEIVIELSEFPEDPVLVGNKILFGYYTEELGFEPYALNLDTDKLTLLKDISPGSEDGDPVWITKDIINGKILFAAVTSEYGMELYITDGTPGNTKFIKDINPGLDDSDPWQAFALNGKWIFQAFTEEHGTEFWISDGTANGTSLLIDLGADDYSGVQGTSTFMNNRLIFPGRTESGSSREIWVTDGTAGGTKLLKAFPDLDLASGFLESARRVGSRIYFVGRINGEYALMVSDGTSSGTKIVVSNKDYPGLISYYLYGIGLDDQLLFQGFTPQNGKELWITDGTESGTRIVADLLPGQKSSSPSYFVRFGEGIAFWSWFDSIPQNYYTEGTLQSTRKLGEASPESNDGSRPTQLLNFNNSLHFLASDGDKPRQWWRYSHQVDSSGQISSFTVTPTGVGADLSDMGGAVVFKDHLFFGGSDPSFGLEIWKSDGTAGGTSLLKDINPGSGDGVTKVLLNNLIATDDLLFFSAFNPSTGIELWASDGTLSGTNLVKDINDGSGRGVYLDKSGRIGNKIIFRANDGDNGAELWVSDGSELGTYMLKDIRAGSGSSNPNNFFEDDGKLVFVADDGIHGIELWETDGTPAGTKLVLDVAPGSMSSSPSSIVRLGANLVFAAHTVGFGNELMKLPDGATSAQLVKDINAGNTRTNIYLPQGTVVDGDKSFFIAKTQDTGFELWVTNGTSTGTYLLKDIYPGQFGGASNTTIFQHVGLTYFMASTPDSGRELWQTDGTAAGTLQVLDLLPGKASGAAISGDVPKYNGLPFFAAEAPTVGIELFTIGQDACPDDPNKGEPGYCGCGLLDVDTDSDDLIECSGGCPDDPNKLTPGVCGCGVEDSDYNFNGIVDCLLKQEFPFLLTELNRYVKKLKPKRDRESKARRKKQKQYRSKVKILRGEFILMTKNSAAALGINSFSQVQFQKVSKRLVKLSRKVLKRKSTKFAKNKRKLRRLIKRVLKSTS